MTTIATPMTTTHYPPGPKGGLFNRRLISYSRRDPLSFVTSIACDYGDISHFRIGGERVFFLNHPDYIKFVLVTHYANFLKGRGKQRVQSLLGRGLLLSEGDVHRRQRQLVLPAFHRQRIGAYAEVMAQYAARHSSQWEDGQTLDIRQEMMRLTIAIVGKTLFDTDVESEVSEIQDCVEAAMHTFKAFRLPLAGRLEHFPLPHVRRSRKAGERLKAIIHRMVAERRESGRDRGDLLSMLLLSRGEEMDGEPMSDEQIYDEALTILLGGYETVALALTWTLYLLSQHPEVEAKLHGEVDAVLDGGRMPTVDDLPRLRYAEMVCAESMRLYPPVWRLVRRAIKDFEVGGYVVPAGALVVMSQYAMHRDRRYFPEPLRFDPERWMPEAKASRPAYSYFPFGGGPRRCIGEGFAWMEAILLLATLTRRRRFHLLPENVIELLPLHTLRSKNSILMTTERRA